MDPGVGASRPGRSRTQGLRVSVRLFGDIVSQRTYWAAQLGLGEQALYIGRDGADAVPTPDDGAVVEARWRARNRVALRPLVDGMPVAVLQPGDLWSWSNGQGVSVDLDLIGLQRAERGSATKGWDLALLTMILIFMVGMAQLNYLFRFFDTVSLTGGMEPSPEYIARLLEKDYDGEEEGLAERAERPDFAQNTRGFYLPAGNDGPKTQIMGGKEVGPEVVREDEPEEEVDAPEHELAKAEEDQIKGLDAVQQPDAPPDDGFEGAVADAYQERRTLDMKKPLERFIGWGFRDWYDVGHQQTPQEQEIARSLDWARHRLRIDPDDPQALSTVGYYGYLAENYELCQDAYERLVEKFPEEPAGYNNLALTYKRSGEYDKEEQLYRKAIELDPYDRHVLNNLAVNLAHQARYDEALALMKQLEALDPDDPYADLHRAKIYAAMGRRMLAYEFLEKALEGAQLASARGDLDFDTLHHIEFKQDIRVDPVFREMRSENRFARLLTRYYGQDDDLSGLRSSAPNWRPRG